MKIIKFNKNFYNQFQTKIEKRNSLSSKSIQEDVKKIIYDVKKNGDKSLIKYAAKFDKVKISKQDLSLDLSKIKIQSKVEPQIFNSFKKAIKNISRITIVTTGTPQVIEQIRLQLTKLVPVHKVAEFKREDKGVIFKEMALFKVVGKRNKIDKCLNACKKFNPVILDETKTSAVIQITALRREIDKMNKKLKPLGLISTSRTGAVAMTRGAKIFN